MSTKSAPSANELRSIFSQERIQRLQDIYALSLPNTVLLHEQLSTLNGTLHASISILEVHLRNVALIQLKNMYGHNWQNQSVFRSDRWLRGAIKNAIKSAKRNNYSKQDYRTRVNLKATFSGTPEEVKRKAIHSMTISEGDLVAHLYFSFWRKLFSKSYEPQLWLFGLRKIFPKKSIKRGTISDALETCYKVRNRVSHNELVHPHLCREYLNATKLLTKEMRIHGQVRKGRIFRFQEPYLIRIEHQLSELSHFLDICHSERQGP